MPRTKEIDAAWKAHDLQNDGMHDIDCDKRPGWNNALGHSKFNAGCKAWVAEYITKNPIPRIAPPAPPVPAVKEACAQCRKLVREDRLFEEPLFGELVCSEKCAARYASKHMNERDAMVREEIVKKIAATGERPRKATTDEPKPPIAENAPAGPVVVAAPSPAPETPLNPTPVPLPLLPEPLAPPTEPHFESPFTPIEEPEHAPMVQPVTNTATEPAKPATQQTDQTTNDQ